MFGLDKKDEPKPDEALDTQSSAGTTIMPADDNDDAVSITVNNSSDQQTPNTPQVNEGGTVSLPETEITLPEVTEETAPSIDTEQDVPIAQIEPTPVESTPTVPETPDTPTKPESSDSSDNLPEGADFQEVPEEKEEEIEEPQDIASSTTLATPTDLESLKAATLKDLAPIVGRLDLEPTEKLKTIMDMYESTKDQTLLKEAHEAAIALPDDTARAKALLDLVHKIDELV